MLYFHIVDDTKQDTSPCDPCQDRSWGIPQTRIRHGYRILHRTATSWCYLYEDDTRSAEDRHRLHQSNGGLRRMLNNYGMFARCHALPGGRSHTMPKRAQPYRIKVFKPPCRTGTPSGINYSFQYLHRFRISR